MTDIQQPTELPKLCRSCGNFYAARLEETHKSKGCPARTRNTLRQYRQDHGGEHVKIDDHLTAIDNALTAHNQDVARIDTDYNAVFDRLNTLEDKVENGTPTATPASAGIAVSGYLDEDPAHEGEPVEDAADAPTVTPVNPALG